MLPDVIEQGIQTTRRATVRQQVWHAVAAIFFGTADEHELSARFLQQRPPMDSAIPVPNGPNQNWLRLTGPNQQAGPIGCQAGLRSMPLYSLGGRRAPHGRI